MNITQVLNWKDSESSNLICEGFSYRMSVGQDGANKMSVVDQDHPPRRGSLFLKSVRIPSQNPIEIHHKFPSNTLTQG